MRCIATALALLLACVPAVADEVGDLTDSVAHSLDAVATAGMHVVLEDRPAALGALDGAEADLDVVAGALAGGDVEEALGRRARAVRKRVDKYAARLDALRAELLDGEGTQRGALRVVRRAVRAGRAVASVLRRVEVPGFLLVESKAGRGGLHAPGRSAVVRVLSGVHGDGSPCTDTPEVTLEDLAPGEGASASTLESLGKGRWRVVLGDDAGGVLLAAGGCGVERTALLVNLGGGAPGREAGWGLRAPAGLDYGETPTDWRAGIPITPREPQWTGGPLAAFSVVPPLPGGLVLDPATGAISGTAVADRPSATYTVTAGNAAGSVDAALTFAVTPALPEGVLYLEDGYTVERRFAGLNVPVKMAFAPDGRLFFNELRTGCIRVVDDTGALLEEPFATVSVATGAEQGLLGLALDPGFAENGYLYVYATVPADGEIPVRNRILRFIADGNAGIDPLVLVDDLPAGVLHNAGDLRFGPDGNLYLTTGDTGDPALAQADGSLAGRVLRYRPDGGIPADNPDPASPEWARGFRNSFDMAFHPSTGLLFASENGPTFGDEINLVQAGKNYEWETLPEEFPGSLIGPSLWGWTPVIAPTGIAWVTARNGWEGFTDNLLVGAYDTAEVRRLVMSGAQFTDVDEEIVLLRLLDEGGVANKPLDVLQGPDGGLWVSTFDGLWRIALY